MSNGTTSLFPFERNVRDLPNGLRVVVVPTGYPDIVALEIVVAAGSRNEVEAGRTGFAHFFEHMMFRGTRQIPAEEATRILKDAGADQNAYTTDDFTCYHTTFLKEDLRGVLEIEADRLQFLDYDEAPFRTEAKAVLGEYNKSFSDPFSQLYEAQRAHAFTTHPYRHTTMGFLKDIERMPEMMDYSRQFFRRFYRPERTTVILAGDVDVTATHALVEELFGGWERGHHPDTIPAEPAPVGPIHHHVQYASKTMPWVSVAFRGPSDILAPTDVSAMEVLAEVGFSQGSPLEQRLLVEEQSADKLVAYFPRRLDPYLLTVFARVRGPEDVPRVREAIQAEFATLREELVDAARLADIQSNLRYRFATALDDSTSVADALARSVAGSRDPFALDRRFAAYASLTPHELQAAARRYITDERMVVVTLSHEAVPTSGVGSVEAQHVGSPLNAVPARTEAPSAAPLHSTPEIGSEEISPVAPTQREVLLLPGAGPVIDFRITFPIGAAHDPAGRPGLAHLTAMMIAESGSQAMPFGEIQRAHFRRASTFAAQVDKEMTVFIGKGHRDHAEALLRMTLDQLVTPGFREEDFRRVASRASNQVRVGLRANNDEELAKELLLEKIYEGHPYGSLTAGHLGSLESFTLDDVRRFFAQHFRRGDARLAVAGSPPDSFVDMALVALERLPAGNAPERQISAVPPPKRTRVTLVAKDTPAVALSIGFPIDVTRSHPDYPALLVARSYLGEHRSGNSLLFQRMRELRGLNYGDYAYIEYFPRGMFQFQPCPNLVRSQQAFQIWIRPVLPHHAHFALRLALFELERLVRDGISPADFEATRRFLRKSAPLLLKSQGDRLGHAMDSEAYGIPPWDRFLADSLDEVTPDSVNAAVRHHLGRDAVHVVAVAKDADALGDALASDARSPITYDNRKEQAVLAEDAVVARRALRLRKEDVEIIPLEDVFA